LHIVLPEISVKLDGQMKTPTPQWNRMIGCFADMFPGRYLLFLCFVFCLAAACAKVGPDFKPPSADVEHRWMEINYPQISAAAPDYKDWWRIFDDSTLSALIDTAYRQNLKLQAAGLRVLESRAQLGIAIGQWYPQTQQAFGSISRNEIGPGVGSGAFGAGSRGGTSAGSGSAASTSRGQRTLTYYQSELGMQASWELDFWGKFRRAIESARMNLFSSVAAYDSTLVTLTADVASNYVTVCTLKQRLKIAEENAELQKQSLEIAQARQSAGATGERDVQEAVSQLRATQATIPQLQADLGQTRNALAILLGKTPAALGDRLAGSCLIPSAPPQVAVGIPLDLLRRRPDIREAQYQAAAQSARIGFAKAEIYPAFSLKGTFQVLATTIGDSNLGDMFSWDNRLASVGPSFQWNIFNYGRIKNNVRLQDARFQEFLVNYRNLVLQAQQEVENGLVGFLNAQDRTALLRESVAAANRSVGLAVFQYREGAVDYTTLLTAQQNLLVRQDQLASTQGQIAQYLVSVYRALGGGWEIRLDRDFVSPEIQKEMAERTDWDGLLQHEVPPSPSKGPRILPPPPQW
jgi:NodT family efflux transporter outer membrane factor (OMF) lipoprotein